MSSTRKTSLVAGIFYLITFISIPTLALYGPVKNHRDWILSSGAHTGVLVGGFLEVIVALAGVGTAVTLYPVLKRQNEGLALGFVTSRVLEGSMIFAGVASLLSLVTLRHGPGGAAGANTAALVTTGASHVAVYNWTFLLGQSLMPAINAILLGTLLYQSRLVPRALPVLGLIGAPLLLTADIATLFGSIGPVAGADRPAQVHDLGGLGHRRPAGLLQHGGEVGTARVQERIERLVRPGARAGVRPPAAHRPTTAIASLACTRIVSPGPADTSATLTSSSPAPVSTRAKPSPSRRSTVTATAVSEQVMQTSSWHSAAAGGRPPAAASPFMRSLRG